MTSSTPQPVSSAARAVPIILGLVLVALGGTLVARTAPMVMKSLASRSWPESQAVILVSEKVRTTKIAEGKPVESSASVRLAYRYEAGGESYSGTRISFAELDTMAPARADDLVARFPRGATTFVRVNPRNPGEAVLEPGLRGSGAPWAIGALAGGIVSLAVGLGLLVKRRRASRRR